jgi:hypothetical protein
MIIYCVFIDSRPLIFRIVTLRLPVRAVSPTAPPCLRLVGKDGLGKSVCKILRKTMDG